MSYFKMIYRNMLISLITAVLADKRIRFLTVFNCWSDSENVQLMKTLNADRIATRVISLRTLLDSSSLLPVINGGNQTNIGVFFQFDCDASNRIIEQCTKVKCFTQNRHWIVYDEDDTQTNGSVSRVLLGLNETRLFVDAEITYAVLNSTQIHPDQITLYDVYNNGHHIGGKLNVTLDRHFVYSRTNGTGRLTTSVINAKSKYDNRCDLSDVTMRVGTVYQIPTNRSLTSEEIRKHYMTDNPNGVQTDVVNKPSYRIGLLIHEMLKYNITWTHRTRWTVNDSYGGIMTDLREELVDLSLAYFAFYDYRLAYMHVIVETQYLRSAFIFRTFGSQNPGLIGNVFFKPFDTSVWICLLVFVVVLAIGIHLIFMKEISTHTDEMQFTPSWFLSMLMTLGVICQQGASIVPRSFNGRFVLMCMHFLSILVYTYYTTEVLSALISSPVSTDIKTLTQLSDSGIRVRFETTTYSRTYIDVTNTSEFIALKTKKIAPFVNTTELWIKPETGLELVRHGGYAYLSDTSTAYSYIRQKFHDKELCDINEINLRPRSWLAFTSNKQSPYKDLFRAKFRKLRDSGILNRFQRIWTPGKPPCMADSIVFSVGLEYAGPLLVFLAGSMLFCLVILAFEIADHRLFAKHRKRPGKSAPVYAFSP